MNLPQQPFTCPRCHLLVEEKDNFCRHCGKTLKTGQTFFYSHTGIILLAVLIGPFALPCVWMSKQISLTAKGIYTAVLLILGVLLVQMCYRMYQLTLSVTQGYLGAF